MASNQRKEEIRIEWKSNYNEAINQIEQVKSSLTNNAYEVDKLNQAQYRLDAEYKKFEKTLDEVGDSLSNNELSNNELSKAIEKLEQRINKVDEAIVDYNKHLEEVSKTSEKTSKTLDDSKGSTDDLADSTNELTKATQTTNETSTQTNILFQQLDSVTFGLSSQFRDLIKANIEANKSIKANTDSVEKTTKATRIATVATNTFKIALKTLLVASGIGLLVIAVQEIVENWESINKSIIYAFNPSKKLKDIELDKLKNIREQGSTIDKNIERLKRQGKTDLEILKMKRLEQAKITSALLEEIRIKREDELKSVTFLKTLKRNTNNWLGDVKIVIGDIAKLLGAKEWGENLIKSGNKNKYYDSIAGSGFDSTEEGKKLLEELDKSRETEARIANEINNIYKRNGEEAKQRDKERNERIKELNKVIKDLIDDIAILEADSLSSSLGADWNKRTNDLEKQREEALSKVEEAYKRHNEKLTEDDKARIEQSNKIINDKFDLELNLIEKEQQAYRQSNLLFYELQSTLEDSNLTLGNKQKLINDFLNTIENADVKEKWSDLLGIKNIEDSIAFMEQFKDEMKDYTIDEFGSFNENANRLQAIRDFNLALLDEERTTALARAEELELSEEQRMRIVEKFQKEQNEIESRYNDASRDLNDKRANQISDYADAASSGIASLGALMSDNFKAQKSFSLAGALIDTYASINKTLSAFSGMPIPGYAIAQAIATGVAGFVQVMQIMKTTPESASSSAPSSVNLDAVGAQPNVQFQQSSESQLAQTIQNQASEPVKAYVVSKDVTSQQQKDSIKRNNSSL